MTPFEELANAIVIQAAKDYLKALKKLKKYPRDAEAKQTRNDCESFFRSSWYSTLTSVDGKLLMRKLQMEVVHDGKRILESGIPPRSAYQL